MRGRKHRVEPARPRALFNHTLLEAEIEMAKKTTAVKDPMTKTEMFSEIAESTGLTRKQVASVFEELGSVIERHIKKKAAGQFTLPGLLKIKTVKKPARPAQKNVPNPFRPGEFMDVAAKPATTKVKILPLKKMKDMVA
jgi:nucleoid DNA-binding protein